MARWLLPLALLASTGCDEGLRTLPPEPDEWGPPTSLVDVSDMWADGRPDGGWHVTPIHAVLLPEGEVLITGWERQDPVQCAAGRTRRNGLSFLLNPDRLTGGVQSVTPIFEDPSPERDVLYCAGHAPTADGRILYTGGARYENLGTPAEVEWGLDYARLYDPDSGSFTRVAEPMSGGPEGEGGLRWYPTNTRLPDGDVLVTGGFVRYGGPQYANLSVERYSPGAGAVAETPWVEIVTHADGRPDMAPGAFDYTHVHQLPTGVATPSGRPFPMAMIGEAGSMLLFDPEARGPDAFHVPDGGGRGYTVAGATGALLPTGDILVSGGESPRGSSRLSIYRTQVDEWRHYETGIGRYHSTAVLLPDGTVLLMNGQSYGPTDGDPRSPQIFDPDAGTLQTQPPWPGDDRERGYHSFALLLRDGRVLVGGGTDGPEHHIGCERTDVRIYSPPYLLRGPRPELAEGSVEISLSGPEVVVEFSGAPLAPESAAVLMATGAVTHAFDQNQRHVPLAYEAVSPTGLRLQPPSASEAPPGDYLLFLLSDLGVPSIGVPLRISL